MSEEAYFIHIKFPVDFRRNLLESSRDVISLLQDYQVLLELRKKRLDTEQQFKEEVREIMLLVNKLEKVLPKHSLNKLKEVLPGVLEEEKKREPSKKTKKQIKKKEPEQKDTLKGKQLSDIQKLEKALESINSKLHKL